MQNQSSKDIKLMKIHNKLSILLVLGLISCSTNTPINNSENTRIINLSQNNTNNINIDVGQVKNGASISVSINFKNGFNTKANSNGTLSKNVNDVQSYEVYLIKNSASTYPVNGDPIGDKVLGPYILNSNGVASSVLTFNNILSSGGQYYYVAVRAFDNLNATGNSLIKANTSWTGTTANTTYNKQVAVSNGSGILVSSTYLVTSTSRLNVNPNLLDASSATVDTSITVNNGVSGISPLNFSSKNNIIGEFMVNTYTISNQIKPSISSDSSGNFVITWQDGSASSNVGQDGSNYGIYAQRYNSLGIPQGSEFRVNTYTTNLQMSPSICSDSSGNFVITWQSRYQDGSGYGVYAQRYNSLGIPQGSEFRVNSFTNNWQILPSIASDKNGNFVITWQSRSQDGSFDGIYAQRYNNLGVPQGSEFKVNSYTTDWQTFPVIAMDNIGNFVITWKSTNQDGSSDGVYAQRYNSLSVPQGSEFRVNTYTTNAQVVSSIGMDSNGNFIITWSGDGSSGYGIYAQRYNSLGIPQGSEFKVNTYTTNIKRDSSIAIDSNGNFVITWTSRNQASSNSYYDIYAQRYNSLGVSQGSEFKVNTYTTSYQKKPSISSDMNGNFVISWYSFGQDGSGYGVYAKRFNNKGYEQ
ncbi:MAG: hypothetical protein U0354_06700 [Candidatus Sericytochromatia bacterium]